MASKQSSNGVTFIGLLFLLLLGLKLANIINWSWWWITAPIWASASLVIIVCLVVLLVYIFKRNP